MTSPRIKRDNEWSSKKIGLWTKRLKFNLFY